MAASSISRSRTANSTDSGQAGATILAKLERAVFGVLHLMLDSRSSGTFLMRFGAVLLVIPRFLTTAALAVSPASQLLAFLNLFRIEQFFAVKEDPIIFLAVYTLGLFVVWTSILCAASTAWFFTTGFFSTFLPALFLRAVVGIFITALLNPLLELFLVPFQCASLAEYFPSSNYEAVMRNIPTNLVLDCTQSSMGGMQVALIIISILSLVAFVPFSIVTKAVYLDTDPVSLDYTAAYTGKLAVYDTVARAILVFATHFLRAQQPILHAIIVIVTMGPLTFLSIVKQPFYYKTMNSISCAMYAFITWLAIESLILTANSGNSDLQHTISTVMCSFLAIIIPLAIAAPIIHLQYVQIALTGVLELVKEKELIERQKMFSKGSFILRNTDSRPIMSATLASPLVSIHEPKKYAIHQEHHNGDGSVVFNLSNNNPPTNPSPSTVTTGTKLPASSDSPSNIPKEEKYGNTGMYNNKSHPPRPIVTTFTSPSDQHSRTVTMSSEESSSAHKKGPTVRASLYPDAEQNLVDATLFPHKKHANKTRKHLLRGASTDGTTKADVYPSSTAAPHHHHHHQGSTDEDNFSSKSPPNTSIHINNSGPDTAFEPTDLMINPKKSKAVATLLGSNVANEQLTKSSLSISSFVTTNTAIFRPIPGIEFVSVRDSSVQSARAARLFHDRPDFVNAMALLVIKVNPRPDILPMIDHKRHIQAGFFPREAIARAESVFEMGLLAFPSDPDVTVAYARFLGSFVKDSSRASGMLQRVTKCKPDMEHRFALFSYGRFLEQRRAREDLGEGLDGLGVIAFRQGYASALSAYRQAVAHIASLWKAIEAHRRTLRGSLTLSDNPTSHSKNSKTKTKQNSSNDSKNNDNDKNNSYENDGSDEYNALLQSSSNNHRNVSSKNRSRSRSHQNREQITGTDSSSTTSLLTTSGIMVRLGRIVSARREAQREFEKLLARYTSAAQVLQSYATFLEHVCMDTLAAQGATARADAAVSGAERPDIGNGGEDGENNRAGSIAPTKSAVGVDSAYGGQSSIIKSSNSSGSGSNAASGSRGGGSQSQGGGSSAKSSSTNTFTRGNTSGTEAVVRLRSRMQRGMVLVALFAIAIFVATRIVLSDFTTLVDAIFQASNRRYSIVAGAFHARSVSLATMDGVISPEKQKAEWDFARSWLLSEAKEATDINKFLYDTNDARGTLLFPKVRSLYDEPWFPILYVSGNLNVSRYGGFQEAVQTYVGTLTAIANLPAEVIKYPNCDKQPSWRFVLDNWSGLFKSANLISTVYVDRAFELGETFADISWVLFALVLLILYVLLFHVFWPSVKLVQSSNAGVIAIIEAIPISVIVTQVKKYSMLEVSLHAETDKILDDDGDSSQDIDDMESDSSTKDARHSRYHRRKEKDDSSSSYSSTRSSRDSSDHSSRSRSRSYSDNSDGDSSDSNKADPRDKKRHHSDTGIVAPTVFSPPVAHARGGESHLNNTETRLSTNDYNSLKPEGLNEIIGITSPSHDPVPVTITSPVPIPSHRSGTTVSALQTSYNSTDNNSSILPGAVASPSPVPTPIIQTQTLSRVPSMIYAPTAHLHGMQHPVYAATRIPPIGVLRTPTTASNQGDVQNNTGENDSVAIPVSPQPIQIRSDGVNILENDTNNRYRRSRRDKEGSKTNRKSRSENATITSTMTLKQQVWERFGWNKQATGTKLSPLLRALTFRTAAALFLLGSLQALATGLNTSEVKASTFTASSINYGSYRRELAITCVFHARELLIGPDILGDYRFSAQDFRLYLDDFRRYHRGLLYGDPALRLQSSLGSSTDQDNLLFSPLSEAFMIKPEQNLSIATTYASSAATQGLNFLLLQFLNQLEILLSRYEPWWGTEETKKKYADTYFNGTTPPFDAQKMGICLHNLTCIHEDPDFARIEAIDFGSLDPLLKLSMSHYSEEVQSRSDRGLWVQIAVLILNLGVLAVFYFFVTERQFYYLNQEAQRTLELVRLIPVAAIDSSSKLRAIINCSDSNTDNANSSGKGSGRVGTRNISNDVHNDSSGNENNMSHGRMDAGQSDTVGESSATSGGESTHRSNKHGDKNSSSSGSLRTRSRRTPRGTPKVGSP